MSKLGYRQLLREQRDFRRLWLGDVASFLGDWFNLIAIYTSVQAITDSRFAIAAVVVAKTLPNFLMIPIAGPIVDRVERRRLLILSDVARAVCVIGLVVAHHAGSLVGLYASTFAMICFTAIAFPTKRAVLPMVVPRERLGIANAILGGTWSVMLAFGSALGGVAVQYLGVTASFGIDAATFLVSALIFARLPLLPAPEGATAASTRFRAAWRYMRRAPQVLALTCIKPFGAFANAVVIVCIPVYGVAMFPDQSGPLYVGLLYAARGVGAANGALVVRMLFGDHPKVMRRLIAVNYALIIGSLTLVAHAGSYWVAAVGFCLSGLGASGNWVLSGTLLQLEADESYHGRIFSFEFGVTTLALACGGALVGVAQDYWHFSVAGVTQWWGLLAIPALLFWVGTLLAMRFGKRGRNWAAESDIGSHQWQTKHSST